MNRTSNRIVLLVLAAALAAVALARVSVAAASSDRGPTKTLHYGVAFVKDVQIDLGARGPSAGDQRTFYDVLFDRSGRRIGYSGGVCAVESTQPPVFSCTVTFSLPGGQIATQLLTTPGPAPKPLAVIGGTGAYRGVRGEGTLVEFGKDKGDKGTVTFRLTW